MDKKFDLDRMPPALRKELEEEEKNAPRLIQELRELQPTGDLLADMEALWKIRNTSLDRVYTNPVTGEELANYRDAEDLYQHLNSPELLAQRKAVPTEELPKAHQEAFNRIIAAYEAKRSK